MHKAFKLLLLSMLLSACTQISKADMQATQEADIQATNIAFRTTRTVETALARTAVARSSIEAFATKAAALPPMHKLNEVCQGQPVPEAGIYSTSSEIHPVYFSPTGGLPRRLDQNLPGEWRPRLISEAQIVVCISDAVKTEVVEVCRYGLQASGFIQATITRYRATLTLRLLEAKTGRLIDEESFQKDAMDCPSSTAQTFDSKYSPRDFEYSDIKYWLIRFVTP